MQTPVQNSTPSCTNVIEPPHVRPEIRADRPAPHSVVGAAGEDTPTVLGCRGATPAPASALHAPPGGHGEMAARPWHKARRVHAPAFFQSPPEAPAFVQGTSAGWPEREPDRLVALGRDSILRWTGCAPRRRRPCASSDGRHLRHASCGAVRPSCRGRPRSPRQLPPGPAVKCPEQHCAVARAAA